MYCNLPAPIERLFRREAGIFEPAVVEEFSGAVRSGRPYQPGNDVNHKKNVLRLPSLRGTLPWRCHPRIIVLTFPKANPRGVRHGEQLGEEERAERKRHAWAQKARSCGA